MPLWLIVAIWILWSMWSVLEVYAAFEMAMKNNQLESAGFGRQISYTKNGVRWTMAWGILSVMWICFNVFG